jgi:hypothetical protein
MSEPTGKEAASFSEVSGSSYGQETGYPHRFFVAFLYAFRPGVSKLFDMRATYDFV